MHRLAIVSPDVAATIDNISLKVGRSECIAIASPSLDLDAESQLSYTWAGGLACELTDGVRNPLVGGEWVGVGG